MLRRIILMSSRRQWNMKLIEEELFS